MLNLLPNLMYLLAKNYIVHAQLNIRCISAWPDIYCKWVQCDF